MQFFALTIYSLFVTVKQECIPVGCVLSAAVAILGRVCLAGGEGSPREGGVCLAGGSVQGGVCLAGGVHPLWTDRHL